jgi:hypothetical protein
MLKKGSSEDPFKFKLDRSEDTPALGSRSSTRSASSSPCTRLSSAAPWSLDLENEESADSGGPVRETFAKVCAEAMMPQLGLFVRPLNDRIRDKRRQNVLIPSSRARTLACRTSVRSWPSR